MENIDLASLARMGNYSYDYFRHTFKKKYGMSPKKYQVECRLRHAAGMLMNTDYNCTEIARLCGLLEQRPVLGDVRRTLRNDADQVAKSKTGIILF